jgi:crotonobetainyl-CoA:carnitine CoA-transferase CaiB-like acyl-CoA transferase
MSKSSGIFAGIKVIDCASFIAAPAAGTILSDFGADVIKVEPPGTGDPQRFLYKIPPNPAATKNYWWQLTNRNKKSIALNLKNAGSLEILQRLVKNADVFIVNFPPHVRKALKLTYDDISALNPKIIYADVTGYGENGPEADKPGFDVTAYWARSGIMDASRNAGSPPPFPVPGMGDHATASALYGAIVTGLYRREKTGTGCHVTTSLIAEGAWAAAGSLQASLDGAKFYPLSDRTSPINALGNTYQAQDNRWLILTLVQEDKDWPGLIKALGKPELLSDKRFSDTKKRRANAKELTKVLDEVFSTKPISYWREILDKERVTFGVVQTLEELAFDPQLRENDVIRQIKNGTDTNSFTVDSPIKIKEETKVQPTLAPGLGEHTNEVLGELGYQPSEIETLRTSGIVA